MTNNKVFSIFHLKKRRSIIEMLRHKGVGLFGHLKNDDKIQGVGLFGHLRNDHKIQGVGLFNHFKNHNNIKVSAFYRIGPNRGDILSDTNSNAAYRVYILKSKALYQLGKEGFVLNEYEDLTPQARKFIDKDLEICYKGLIEFLSSRGESPEILPNRVQIFFHPEDNYYSFVFGFKLKSSLKFPIQDTRYIAGCHMLEQNLKVFFISNYETHKPISYWDDDHVSSGPITEYNKKQFALLINKEIEEEIGKPAKLKKKFIKPRKSIQQVMQEINSSEENLGEEDIEPDAVQSISTLKSSEEDLGEPNTVKSENSILEEDLGEPNTVESENIISEEENIKKSNLEEESKITPKSSTRKRKSKSPKMEGGN